MNHERTKMHHQKYYMFYSQTAPDHSSRARLCLLRCETDQKAQRLQMLLPPRRIRLQMSLR